MSSAGDRLILGQQRAEKHVLPPERVFSIQIGSKLFRLSGASISSDAPSYFSQFFKEQLKQSENGTVRTLYIDRDPVTFQDICKHLQGYHVRPRDGQHFVQLFADAQFYNLSRLVSQLFESDIFIQIGERHFQIPRDIFSSPGNSPNFFSLGFNMFFSSPKELFPGVDRKEILRPPAIIPSMVSNRSGETFAQLLHMLRGYPVQIKNEEHRQELLRDCQYYHLRGLEQRLIPHTISYNFRRQTNEILLRLEDIRQSGIKLVPDRSLIYYARPFVDDPAHPLIIEIGGGSMLIDLSRMDMGLHGQTRTKLSKLVEVVTKNLQTPDIAQSGSPASIGSISQVASPAPTSISLDRVSIRFDEDSAIVVDGKEYAGDWRDIGKLLEGSSSEPSRKRPREEDSDSGSHPAQWIVQNGQWRPQVISHPGSPVKLLLVAVKVDVSTSQKVRNAKRDFLGN